jgi:imidazolonepropionase-like amidohydrolase
MNARRLLGLVTIAMLASSGGAAAAPPTRPTATKVKPAAPKPAARAKPRAGKLAFDRDDAPVFLVGAQLRSGGTRLDGAVIEIRGTRIASVSTTAPSAGAKVVDLGGKIVTPGIVAVDSSLGLVEIDAEGSTKDDSRNVADPIRAAYDASSAINVDSVLVQVNAIEGVTSAATTPRGGLVSGQVAWIDLAVGDRDMVSASNVAMRMQLGQTLEGSRAATWLRINELFDDVEFHRTHRAAYDRNQSRDLMAHRLDLEALAPYVAGRAPFVVAASRASDLRLLVQLAKRGMKVVALGGSQAWKVADELAAAKIPVIVQPSQNLPASLDDIGARLDNAALLAAAGVELGIAVLGDAHNSRNATQEAGLAVSYGLDPDVALSAITSVPARAYGMDAHYGTVAPGKVANLVVWNGDPFELSERPVAVWVRGKPIEMRSRQTELRDRYMPRVRGSKK